MKVLPFAASATASSAGRRTVSKAELSRREESIVAALMAGRSNRAIAQDLGLAEQSVKNRLTPLYRKFGVHSRLQLILALTKGIR